MLLVLGGCGSGNGLGGDGGSGGAGGDGGSGSDGGAPATSRILATFRTLDTAQYLSAANGGGGPLTAGSNTAGSFETFTLVDLDGGALVDGDLVYLVAANGEYLSAANGGGGALAFDATSASDDETFRLTRVDGAGPIAAGDHVAFQTLVTGNYVSAIDGGGGEVLANAPWAKAWETFIYAPPATGAGDDAGVTPSSDGGLSASAQARQKVIDFLRGISGQKTAIGLEDKSSSQPHHDSDTMASEAGNGEYPSFWSGDWGFGGAVGQRENIVQEGKARWAAGAIVQYIYHACSPTMGDDENCSYENDPSGNDIKGSKLDANQWNDLVTPGGTLYQAWLRRLDKLAVYFQELKDAGVAPLFRPLHEMNGAWAWWTGHPGPNGSARLFQITHDYLVEDKGLDNIVWVWNVQDYPTLAADVSQYTPGTSYFDVAALDVYNTGYTSGNYDAMRSAAGGKPIGIGECATLITTGQLDGQPNWAYVALWPDYLAQNQSAIAALFRDPRVLTLSKMPGWQ